MLSEWNMTVVGGVVCIVFSWFLGIVSRSEGVQFGKTGPIVGIVGIFVLAGMAIAGSLHVPPVRDNGVQSIPNDTVERLRLVYKKTKERYGPRPSNDHVAYEDPTGKLSWVTLLEYKTLRYQDRRK